MKKKTILKYIIIAIYVIYISSIIGFLKENQLNKVLIIACCIVGTAVLGIINKKINKILDNSIYINLSIFILIAALFGTCLGFYSINHYDDFLHLYSGILSCNMGYLIIKYFNNESNLINMHKAFIIIFLFMFAMGVASLWEIMEFSIDTLFGAHTQIGGLQDTMIDMIDAFVGAIISIPYFIKKLKSEHT